MNIKTNKIKGLIFITIPFTYFLSLGLIGLFSYDIFNTFDSAVKISDFKYTLVDSVFEKSFTIKAGSSSKVSYSFNKKQIQILLTPLDTSYLPEKYLEINYFDSNPQTPAFYKNVPVYYALQLNKAYYSNSNTFNKKMLFEKILWKICALVSLIICVIGGLYILKKECSESEKIIFKKNINNIMRLYVMSVLILLILGFLNWYIKKFIIIEICFFFIPIVSIILAFRAIPKSDIKGIKFSK